MKKFALSLAVLFSVCVFASCANKNAEATEDTMMDTEVVVEEAAEATDSDTAVVVEAAEGEVPAEATAE